jgi:hypothetical protein
MKRVLLAAACPLAAALALAAPAGTNPYRLGNSRVSHSCDIELNVVDPDPAGANLRSAPSTRTGQVIGRLEPDGEWTQVHVVGQAGAWLLIDRADTVDDEAPEGMREVFRGGAWMHRDTLGVSELTTGEGTVVRESPADDAAVVLAITLPEHEPSPRARVLGCKGKWLHVDLDAGTAGWTRTWCNNERTTCS